MSGILDGIGGIGLTIGKGVLVSELKKQGQKLVNKDTNNTGRDDAGGQSLLAIANAVDAIDVTDNPKSLINIGNAFIAAGESIKEAAKKADQ